MIRSEVEAALVDRMAEFEHDPLGFVRFAFPWGEPGELLDQVGPREWQAEILGEIGRGVARGMTIADAVQIAVASGHGIGKSALVAWIVYWAMSTKPQTRGIVTANTDAQLRTKTWPEVTKWHRLAINSHWFKITATALFSSDPAYEKTWRFDATPWSERRTESFAGLHNKGRRVVVIFDEASAIPDIIWQVTEGALTDEGTELLWCVFGNPTRNTGRFRECFGRLKHRWTSKQIDSRKVDGTNKTQSQKWVEDYGEDSDFVRVRVKGEFPRAGSNQFIPSDIVAEAARREPKPQVEDPIVMGLDIARFGDDNTVGRIRRGLDGRSIPPLVLSGNNLMQVVGRASAYAREHKVDMIFADETGVGGGVVDRMRQLGFAIMGVNNGSKPDVYAVGDEIVSRKDAEMWARARVWLREGGAIPDDLQLKSQLESREFSYDAHNAIVLEPKDAMKRRGLSSPDDADSFCLTFAYPVMPKQRGTRSAVTRSHDEGDGGGQYMGPGVQRADIGDRD